MADMLYVTATLFGEARGEVFKGKMAVAWVIRNRAEAGGWYISGGDKSRPLRAAVLKPWQFSCWNHGDPNYNTVADIANNWRTKADMFFDADAVRDCLMATMLVCDGRVKDMTGGATHYHAKSIMPSWAEGKVPCARIGNHIFYNNID